MSIPSEIPVAYDLQLQSEIAQLIVDALNLEVTVDTIDPDAALYGDGLGLDSIDVLEVALLVSKKYGVQLRADNGENREIFSSLRSLTTYVSVQRAV